MFKYFITPIMEEEYFDVCKEGSSLIDLDIEIKDEKMIVLDKTGQYGTTVDSKKLNENKYIKNLVIKVNQIENINIELFPCFLTPENRFTKSLEMSPFVNSIDYVLIDNFFYVNKDKKILKIPYNSTDIFNCSELLNTDKFYMSKAFKEKNLLIFVENCRNEKLLTYEAIKKNVIEINLFNSNLLYPVYGFSCLSEHLAMNLSMKGVMFCVNEKVKQVKSLNEKYPYRFEIKEATIYSKKYDGFKLPEGRNFVRVIVTENYKFTGNFKAFVDGNEIVTVYGLNALSNCCPDGFQMLYFTKKHSKIDDFDLKLLTIDKTAIKFDASFETNFSIEKYTAVINK
ncbi:hypothetical protein NUSPORA_00185 [Nucleospora cyclopteri]